MAAHLWIWRGTKGATEVLLQKRAANKRTWPNFYDISAAGHVDFGETPIGAALREAQEEIGIELSPKDIRKLFAFHSNKTPQNSDIIENEIEFVYGMQIVEEQSYVLSDGEVSELRWVSLQDFVEATQGRSDIELVPQGDDYFKQLITAVKA